MYAILQSSTGAACMNYSTVLGGDSYMCMSMCVHNYYITDMNLTVQYSFQSSDWWGHGQQEMI